MMFTINSKKYYMGEREKPCTIVKKKKPCTVRIINGKKYDTDKMERVCTVRICDYFNSTLWRSRKGNWLLTEEGGLINHAEALSEEEAKELLAERDYEKYEELFGEIEEA